MQIDGRFALVELRGYLLQLGAVRGQAESDNPVGSRRVVTEAERVEGEKRY